MIYGDAVVLKARGAEENIVGKDKAGTGHKQDKGTRPRDKGQRRGQGRGQGQRFKLIYRY